MVEMKWANPQPMSMAREGLGAPWAPICCSYHERASLVAQLWVPHTNPSSFYHKGVLKHRAVALTVV